VRAGDPREEAVFDEVKGSLAVLGNACDEGTSSPDHASSLISHIHGQLSYCQAQKTQRQDTTGIWKGVLTQPRRTCYIEELLSTYPSRRPSLGLVGSVVAVSLLLALTRASRRWAPGLES